jgi:hypothetical protein
VQNVLPKLLELGYEKHPVPNLEKKIERAWFSWGKAKAWVSFYFLFFAGLCA